MAKTERQPISPQLGETLLRLNEGPGKPKTCQQAHVNFCNTAVFEALEIEFHSFRVEITENRT